MRRPQDPPAPDLSKTFWTPVFPSTHVHAVRRTHPTLRWGDYNSTTGLYFWQRERFKGNVTPSYVERSKRGLIGMWYGVKTASPAWLIMFTFKNVFVPWKPRTIDTRLKNVRIRERVLELEEQISLLKEQQDRQLKQGLRELKKQMNYSINQSIMMQRQGRGDDWGGMEHFYVED